MQRRVIVILVICFISHSLTLTGWAQSDWANWRGPTGNGIAAEGQKPPTKWDSDTSVIWKSKVPGRGHASPTIIGGKVFLATADDGEQTQSVVCLDRKSGQQLWQTQLYEGGFSSRIHPKNTHASPSIASGSGLVFGVFCNHDKTHIAALDLEGKVAWQKVVGDYKPQFPFGFAQTPIVYKNNVLVTSDSRGDSAIVAYDCKTGKEKWRIDRPKATSYSTPVVADVSGKPQLFISGGKKVHNYDPENGKQNWESPAIWDVTCGTAVWDKDLEMVFVSGGYPANQTLALKASDGTKVWDNRVKVYEQSMIVVDGYVYALAEGGIAYCWKADDGTEMWKKRLEGDESASPVYAGGLIYVTTERGNTFVFKPNPNEFELVSKNKLGDSAFATPSIVDSQIFFRVGDSSQGDRQEWLYCLGNK